MITVNAMGDACPIPVIKTKKALQELSGAGEIAVLVDNETAVRNVTKMAESSGASVTQEKLGEGQYRVIVKVGDGGSGDAAAVQDVCGCGEEPGVYGNTIVAVSSDSALFDEQQWVPETINFDFLRWAKPLALAALAVIVVTGSNLSRSSEKDS